MGRTVEYTGNGKAEKALQDCKDWLGDDYNRIMGILVGALQEGTAKQALQMGLMMQGIQGYPATVMMEKAGELKVLEEVEIISGALLRSVQK